jgi:hypothetical protein
MEHTSDDSTAAPEDTTEVRHDSVIKRVRTIAVADGSKTMVSVDTHTHHVIIVERR